MSNLNELIRLSGIKQELIARKLGVSQATISFWKSGKKNPTIENAVSLAQLFNVTVGCVVGTEPIPEGYPLYTTPTTFAEVMENQKKYVPKFDSESTPEPKEEKPPFTKEQLEYLDRHLEEVVSRIREKEGFK